MPLSSSNILLFIFYCSNELSSPFTVTSHWNLISIFHLLLIGKLKLSWYGEAAQEFRKWVAGISQERDGIILSQDFLSPRVCFSGWDICRFKIVMDWKCNSVSGWVCMSEFYVLLLFCLSCSFYIFFVVWSSGMVIGVGFWFGSRNHGVFAVFAVNMFAFLVFDCIWCWSSLQTRTVIGVQFFVLFAPC